MLGRYTDLDGDKLRGGYYTSPEVAAWLCDWAIRAGTDRVLEPSCGDGVFLIGAVERLSGLGARAPAIADHLVGVEINDEEADRARARLEERLGPRARGIVKTGDFFAWHRIDRAAFDAVVGNPP